MEPLLILGAIALAGFLANAVKQPTVETYEDPPPKDDFHTETQAPAPEPAKPRPLTNPIAPPDPRRLDRIARLFVLETEDEPIPPGGFRAIERRYAMAAEWVRQKVGRQVAYHPDITYLQLPFTSAEIRRTVLSGAASYGRRTTNNKVGSPLYGQRRKPAPEFDESFWPGGLPGLIFDSMENYAIQVGDQMNNPRNPYLAPLDQNWLFIVRGAGGYAAGGSWVPGNRESVGFAICGDSVLTAWLSEGTSERNIAHEVIFIEDTLGRQEWEEGWDQNRIGFTLESRLGYGTPDAQTGSFIHESFHAIFNAVHVTRQDLADAGRSNEWWEDPVNNIMGGSHLDWPNTVIQQVTLGEIDDTGYFV